MDNVLNFLFFNSAFMLPKDLFHYKENKRKYCEKRVRGFQEGLDEIEKDLKSKEKVNLVASKFFLHQFFARNTSMFALSKLSATAFVSQSVRVLD